MSCGVVTQARGLPFCVYSCFIGAERLIIYASYAFLLDNYEILSDQNYDVAYVYGISLVPANI